MKNKFTSFIRSPLPYILGYILLVIVITPINKPLSFADKKSDWEPSATQIQQIQSILESHGVLGASIGLIQNGQLVWTSAFGFSDKAKHVPLTTDTTMRIASISKIFNSLLIFKEIEKNKLYLDIPVSDQIRFGFVNPRFLKNPPTIRHLLAHRSGLNDWSLSFKTFRNRSKKAAHPPTLQQLFNDSKQFDQSSLWLNRQPGRVQFYSNLGHVVLTALLEKITGTYYSELLTNSILKPLKMNQTFPATQAIPSSEKRANLYRYAPKAQKFKLSIDDQNWHNRARNYERVDQVYLADSIGGIRSNVKDLATLMRLFLNKGRLGWHRIISARSIQAMETPYSTKVPHYDLNSGLGLQVTDRLVPGVRLIGHRGIAYGFLGHFFYQPEEKWGYIVLINGMKNWTFKAPFYSIEQPLAGVFAKLLRPALIHPEPDANP